MTDIVTQETTNPTGVKAEKSQTIGYIIYFIFGLIEILFVFRLVLKLTGANPVSGFVSSVYAVTQLFIMPFSGIFPQATAQGAVTTAILEPATIVAIIVYAVLAWGITQLVVILSGRLKE